MDLKDLRAGMRCVNIQGKVIKKTEPKTVIVRKTGRKIKLSVATLEDETGKATLVLWGDQVNEVSEGDQVTVRNGYVRAFRGELQVHIGRRGTLEVK